MSLPFVKNCQIILLCTAVEFGSGGCWRRPIDGQERMFFESLKSMFWVLGLVKELICDQVFFLTTVYRFKYMNRYWIVCFTLICHWRKSWLYNELQEKCTTRSIFQSIEIQVKKCVYCPSRRKIVWSLKRKQFFVFDSSHRCTKKFASFIIFKENKPFSDAIPSWLSWLSYYPPGFLTSCRLTSLLVFRGQILRGTICYLVVIVNDHDFCIAKTEDLNVKPTALHSQNKNQPHWFYEYAPNVSIWKVTLEVLGQGHATSGWCRETLRKNHTWNGPTKCLAIAHWAACSSWKRIEPKSRLHL